MKNPSNGFVVSCVLIIDWQPCRQRVCSPFSCVPFLMYDMEEKSCKCHVNKCGLSEFLCPVSGAMDMIQY